MGQFNTQTCHDLGDWMTIINQIPSSVHVRPTGSRKIMLCKQSRFDRADSSTLPHVLDLRESHNIQLATLSICTERKRRSMHTSVCSVVLKEVALACIYQKLSCRQITSMNEPLNQKQIIKSGCCGYMQQ